MDEVFGTENIKQKGGAISLLTQNQPSFFRLAFTSNLRSKPLD